MYLLHLFEESGENGQCDLVGVERLWMISGCGAPLDNWAALSHSGK